MAAGRAADILWHRWLGRPYRLSCRDVGKGEGIVLLHGLASSQAIWQPLQKILVQDDYRVIAPDLLGFGDSPVPTWSQYTVEDHTRMVRYTLKKQGVKGPVVLVGHSMGCLVATHLAAQYPGLVKRLILFEPPLLADVPAFRGHSRRRERYLSIFGYIASHPFLLFSKNWEMRRIALKVTGMRLRQETWLPFQRSLTNTIMHQVAFDELHHIQIPTDIIHGRMDMVVTRKEVKQMFASNSNITIHTVNRTHGISNNAAIYLARLVSKGTAGTM